MVYNLHPIFVHFPIALLFIYSLMKVLPLKRWYPMVSWRQIENVLLLLGVLGAIAAFMTGDVARHLSHPNRDIVGAHSNFASMTLWFYGLLLLGEVLLSFSGFILPRLRVGWIASFYSFLQNLLTSPFFSKLLAVLGFIAIFITGLLGGVMVYGTSADPLAGIVLKILGINF